MGWVDGTGKVVQGTTFQPFDNVTISLHVVVTVTPGDFARLYCNGAPVAVTSTVVTAIPSPDTFFLGLGFAGAPGLVGAVNEFRVWSGILTLADVAARYAIGPGERASCHMRS